MNDIEFKRLEIENIENMKDIIEEYNKEYRVEDFKKFVIDKDNYAFIGIKDNKVIAFLYGYGMLRTDGKRMFYIHSVDVLSNYQSNGIGTKLIEYVLNYIKEQKCFYKYFVLTENDNIRACKLYQKYANRNEQVLFSSEL